jgi:hypothetical protein
MLEVSERYMDWASTWVTPMGVAQARQRQTATSRLARLTVSATRDRTDIRFAGLFMPVPRLAPNANALL